jgi:predicted dinucleotide-binding enzyme
MTIEHVAVIGPGNVGGDLGVRLARSGVVVTFGVRSGQPVPRIVEATQGRAKWATPADAARAADAIVLALPANVVLDVARGLGDLRGKIVVDANNPLRMDMPVRNARTGDVAPDGATRAGPVWNPPPEGSLAQALAAALPGARVLKAFNTFGHEFHADPQTAAGAVTVPIAGDDADAKADLAALARKAGFAPLDCGPLRNASLLENLATLWVHLAMAGGQGREVAWQLVKRVSSPA